jgi:hypothetical protein
MVRQTNPTGAESCWDDDPQSESDCENYLKAQSARRRDLRTDDEDEAEDADENAADEAEEDVAETAVVAEKSGDNDEDGGDDDEEEPADEESAQLKGRKMAKAKTGKTKADAIREVIAARQAAGKDLRPKDIIETLTKKGIEVNASQVSITLRAMGVPAIKRGPGAGKPAKAAKPEADGEAVRSRATAKVRAAHATVSDDDDATPASAMEHLLEHAADFMREAGGFEKAQSALALCHKLIQRS